MPFQISTSAVARAVPAHHLAERGPREHHVAAGLADHAVAVAPARPAACPARTRCASSPRCRPRPTATRPCDACTSEPPASGSSRSRHASIAIRRRPAAAAMSPSFATTSSAPGSRFGITHADAASGCGHRGGRSVRGRRRAVYGCTSPMPPARRPSYARSGADAVKLTGERPMQGATPDSLLASARRRLPGSASARLGPGRRARRRLRRRRRDRRGSPRRSRSSSASTTARRRVVAAPGRHARRREPAVRGRWTAPRSGPRRRVDCGRVVAHHRALHEPGAARRRARARAAARRHRVRDHAERAGRLREPVPRVPVRARASRVDARSCSSTTSSASASKATTCCRPTSPDAERAASGSSTSTCFDLRHRIPRRGLRVGLRACLPVVYRVLGRDKSGIGSGIDASHLSHPEITPTTPVLFAVARRPRR